MTQFIFRIAAIVRVKEEQEHSASDLKPPRSGHHVLEENPVGFSGGFDARGAGLSLTSRTQGAQSLSAKQGPRDVLQSQALLNEYARYQSQQQRSIDPGEYLTLLYIGYLTFI